jgi:hypothetical protein
MSPLSTLQEREVCGCSIMLTMPMEFAPACNANISTARKQRCMVGDPDVIKLLAKNRHHTNTRQPPPRQAEVNLIRQLTGRQ